MADSDAKSTTFINDDSDLANEVRIEQVLSNSRQVPALVAGNTVNSALLVLVYWETAPRAFLIAWAALIWLVVLSWLPGWWRHRGREKPRGMSRRAVDHVSSGGLVLGGLWGFGAAMLAGQDTWLHNLALLLIIAGMAWGAAATVARVPAMCAAFTIGCVLPLTAAFATQDGVMPRLLAALTLVYGFTTLWMSHRAYAEFLHGVRLNVERIGFLNELRESHERLEQRVAERSAEIVDANEALKKEISERQQVEVSLRESEGQLLSIAENLPGLVYRRVDDADGRIRFTYVSNQARDRFKMDRNAIIADPMIIREMINPGDYGRMNEVFATARKELRTAEFEFRATLPSGDERWAKVIARPHGADHGDVVTDGLVLDITDHKRAEIALRESEARLSSIIANSPLCIAFKDTDGRYLLVNKKYCETFGLREDEVLGRTVHELFPEEHANAYWEQKREVLKLGIPVEKEVDGATTGGTRHFLEIKFPILDPSGASLGLGAIAADITERVLLEEQLRQSQKMQAIGQLTGGVAHEFNNILQGIVGYLELLGTRIKNDPEADGLLEQAGEIAWRGAEITRSLLAFSRKQTLEPRPVDVDDVIVGVSKVLRGVLGEDIAVVTSIDGNVWQAMADPTQLQSALVNLAINSRDAMRDGGLLTIRAGNTTIDQDEIKKFELREPGDVAQPGDYIRLRVTDTGQGIPPEFLEKVFDPFFTTKDVGQGTGLGLSMAYGFATQSKGFVDIESEVGKGTQVNLYLPRTEIKKLTKGGGDDVREVG
jgi:PAS domain S-box-containing protein